MVKYNRQHETSPRDLRIFFLTSDDETFLPHFYDKVFSSQKDSIVGVGIVKDPNFVRFVKNSFSFMGLSTFAGEVFRQIIIRIHKFFCAILKTSNTRSIKGVCDKYDILCTHVKKVNVKRFREYLSGKKINLIISISCPQILKKALLELPEYGCINVHYGLLPEYRGMYPSFWVLANGERETGVTVHFMAEKIDTGEILVQLKDEILPEDSFYSLVKRLKTTIGPEALNQALNKFRSGSIETIKNEHEKGSYYSFPTKEAMKKFKALGRKWY